METDSYNLALILPNLPLILIVGKGLWSLGR